jgi:hypothetical protein
MKAGWKMSIVAGAALMVLSGQVMAQPWAGGPGRGQRWFQGPGRGGPGPMGPQWARQGGRRAGQAGAGAWCPLGMDGGMMRGLLSRRLNLTPDQKEKIQKIVEESRSKVLAKIQEVLTDEQRQQLQQIRDRAGRLNQPTQGRGAGMRGAPMAARGPGQGGRGAGSWGPQRGPGMQQPPVAPFMNGPGAGRRGQGMGAGRGGQGMGPGAQNIVPPLDRLFDRADANGDGALTREELKAFEESMRGGGQSQQ